MMKNVAMTRHITKHLSKLHLPHTRKRMECMPAKLVFNIMPHL